MRQNDPNRLEGTAHEPNTGVYDPREHDEQLDDDAVARQLGYDSFDDAPRVVQNMIQDRDIRIEDPFAPLRRGDR